MINKRVGAYHKKVKPLPWYGGKSGFGKAEWIAGLLPWSRNSTYIETHGGMGSVLCVRDPVCREIFNDLDRRVYNYHLQMRRHKDRFMWEVQYCPHSRDLHEWAMRAADDEKVDDFDRAVAFHVLALQSVAQRLDKPFWSLRTAPTCGNKTGRWRADRVELVAERFWEVQLENTDAVKLLDKVRGIGDAVIYVDPPYHTADFTPYNTKKVEVDALTQALLCQSGKVGVSGYGNEWDHLGWQRHELETFRTSKPNTISERRIEVLWTNYDARVHGSAHQGKQVNQGSLFSI